MDNIEIKRGKIKRSIESIIDDSAIDHQYNYEAQELRKAFNVNIRQLNAKIKDQEREIAKLSLLLQQNQQIKRELANKSHHIQIQLHTIQQQNLDLKRNNNQIKKRLQHVEYKLQSIQSNRNAANMLNSYDAGQQDQNHQEQIKKNIKKEAYNQIHEIINRKIYKFTKQMRGYPIPLQLQRNVQAFLEQILYITPQSLKNNPFNENHSMRDRKIGKISDRKTPVPDRLEQLEQWHKLQKSIEKLKNAGQSHTPRKSERNPRINFDGKISNNERPTQRNRLHLNYT